MKIYLAGAISFSSDPSGWRDQIMQNVNNHTFCNPINIKVDLGTATFGKDILQRLLVTYSQMAEAGNENAIEKIKELGESIIDIDIEKLDECDALILYDSGEPMFGSICEAFWAYRHKKPVFVVTGKGYTELATWCVAIAGMIFRNINELVEYLHNLP